VKTINERKKKEKREKGERETEKRYAGVPPSGCLSISAIETASTFCIAAPPHAGL